MHNEWILDVLTDLKAFASQNGLCALVKQLDDTRLVAMSELAAINEGHTGNDSGPTRADGRHIEGLGKRY